MSGLRTEEMEREAAAVNYKRKGKAKAKEEGISGQLFERPSSGLLSPPHFVLPTQTEPGFLIGSDTEVCVGDTQSEPVRIPVLANSVWNVFPVLSDCPAHPCTHFYPGQQTNRMGALPTTRTEPGRLSPVRSEDAPAIKGLPDRNDMAEDDSVASLKTILDTYEECSGQKLNCEKTGVLFSKKVQEVQKQIFSVLLGVSAVGSHEKYLVCQVFLVGRALDLFATLKIKFGRN